MAGAGRPSTTFLVASSVVVDGGPAPAMTAVGSVALLPDFTVSGLACKAASMPPPLPLLSPLPPRIKASSQPHKRYGIKHDRANAVATQAVGGWLRACSKINESECTVEQALSFCFERQLCRRADALICRRCLTNKLGHELLVDRREGFRVDVPDDDRVERLLGHQRVLLHGFDQFCL